MRPTSVGRIFLRKAWRLSAKKFALIMEVLTIEVLTIEDNSIARQSNTGADHQCARIEKTKSAEGRNREDE